MQKSIFAGGPLKGPQLIFACGPPKDWPRSLICLPLPLHPFKIFHTTLSSPPLFSVLHFTYFSLTFSHPLLSLTGDDESS